MVDLKKAKSYLRIDYEDDDEYTIKLKEKMQTLLLFVPNGLGGYDFI